MAQVGNGKMEQMGCNAGNGRTGSNTGNCKTGGDSSFFQSLSPKSGAILAALTADLLADGLNANQIAALGGFITIIGDSLSFISAQMALQEDSEEPEA